MRPVIHEREGALVAAATTLTRVQPGKSPPNDTVGGQAGTNAHMEGGASQEVQY